MRNKKSGFNINPEEILFDVKASQKEETGIIESPLGNRRFFWSFVLATFALALLFGRAFWLEIVQGQYFEKRSQQNTIRIYETPPLRGIIYDRNGEALVENIPGFNLSVIPGDMPHDPQELADWTKTLANVTGISEEEVAGFVNLQDQKSFSPTLFIEGVDEKQVLELEARKLTLPGIFVEDTSFRHYINGPVFSHVLGYLGKVSNDNLKNDIFYSSSDTAGISGIEYQYEKELRGMKGKSAITVNSKGVALRTVKAEDRQLGNSLKLNISAPLQRKVYEYLSQRMSEIGSKGGAAVILNPQDGRVLSLVSLPSFDNNLFSQGIEKTEYEKLSKNPNRPFFNRVISGNYPSGSTIKPMIASAALEEKIIDPNRLIDDTKGYITVPSQFDPEKVYVYKDFQPHGFVDMRKAIAVSANVYFYTIGGGYGDIKGLGINLIDKYLNLFGLGSVTNIDLPAEAKGLIPNPNWKKATKKENWFLGDTYNVSIGQGDLTLTPLQLANAAATIANNGTLFQPQVLDEISDTQGNIIYNFKPKIIRDKFIKPENLEVVREAMRQTVTTGSATFLAALPVKVAGKTGTAQFGNQGKTYAWFMGFAPYDNPQLAVAFVVEGIGEGAFAAVPVAKNVLQWYFTTYPDKIGK